MGKQGHALIPVSFIGDGNATKLIVAAPGVGWRLRIYRCSWNVDADVATGTFFLTDATNSYDPIGKPKAGLVYGFNTNPNYIPLPENTGLTLDKDSETTSTNIFCLYTKERISASA